MAFEKSEPPQSIAKGTALVLASSMVSTAVAALLAVFLARLLGPDRYGIYTISLVFPSILQYMIGVGGSSAIIKYTSAFQSMGDEAAASKFAVSGLAFIALLSSVLSVFSFALSGLVSSLVFHRGSLVPYVQTASLLVLGQSLLQSVVSVYIGRGRFGAAGGLTVFHSFLRLAIMSSALVLGFGLYGAVLAHSVSYLAAGVISLALLFAGKMRADGTTLKGFLQDSRRVVTFGSPLSFGNLLWVLSLQFVVVLLAASASDRVVGLFEAAANITAVITLSYSAFSTVLLQHFSGLKGEQSKETFSSAIKYGAFVVTPIVVFMGAEAGSLLSLVYGPSFSDAEELLLLLALSYLPASFGLLIFPSVLAGVGSPKSAMLVYLVNASAVFFLAPAFGSVFSVFGLIYSLAASNVAATVAGLILSGRHGLKPGLLSSASILAAAIGSGGLVVLIHATSYLGEYGVIFDGAEFLVLYLTLVPLFRGLSVTEVDQLGTMAADLGWLSPAFREPLRYARAIAKLVA